MEEIRRLFNMVRMGTVMDTDGEKRRARVIFTDAGEPSGWLYVLASPPFMPDGETKPQRTETRVGGGSAAEHYHEVKIAPWMPKVNDTVLCLYFPVFNGDGFILGRIG